MPLDFVSRTAGILAVRGAGKSNTAAVMAEEMFAAGLPFVVIDPVGSWYGLRSSADGTSPGLPIPIFGGKHGDVPLERGSGELIADLVVEKRLTCVLDLSRFDTEADKKAFLLAFARRLYLKNENPLHLFLEEADDYIPQSPMGDEKHLLRAWENIVRRGRARGLGMTLITQRSAAVAKMVLTQVETLFAMRTTGPQDIAAIEAWVKYHQVGKDVLSTLASLEDGEAWVWSPHYLKAMARHQIRRRSTFDSGATPKNVRAKDTRPPATLADIDLAALQERMAATIEKAKADDPKELRKVLAEKDKRIKELDAKLSEPQRNMPREMPIEVHVPFIPDPVRGQVRDILASVERFNTEVREALIRHGQDVERELGNLSAMLATIPRTDAQMAVTPAAVRDFGQRFEASGQRSTPAATKPERPRVSSTGPASGGLGKCERAILTVLVQMDEPLTAGRLTLLTRYRYSGGFKNSLTALRTAGYIVGENTGLMSVTDAGRSAIGEVQPLPTGEELAAYWLGHPSFGKCERAILQALLTKRAGLTAEQLCTATGYQYSGGFKNSLTTLRTAGVLVGKNTEVMRASEELFS